MAEQWTSGLCGCFSDCGLCLYGWCFPGCAEKSTFTKLQGARSAGCGDGCFVSQCCGCCVIPTAVYMDRTWIREKYGIPQDPCNDCLVTCFCLSCSVCQNARELKNRGNAPKRPPNAAMMMPGVVAYPQGSYPQGSYPQ